MASRSKSPAERSRGQRRRRITAATAASARRRPGTRAARRPIIGFDHAAELRLTPAQHSRAGDSRGLQRALLGVGGRDRRRHRPCRGGIHRAAQRHRAARMGASGEPVSCRRHRCLAAAGSARAACRRCDRRRRGAARSAVARFGRGGDLRSAVAGGRETRATGESRARRALDRHGRLGRLARSRSRAPARRRCVRKRTV